jgi:flavin-dependent dehydrogenase
MDDVAIVGAGPAGALAAAILARAGLTVRLFDRARFPRHKLCGDTLNPGALDVLRRHAALETLIAKSAPIHGMVVTGPGGARVTGEYGGGIAGRSITRRVFDQWLVEQAIAAGACFEDGVAIREAAIRDGRVAGVIVGGSGGRPLTHAARIVIAADGRRSTLAVARGLSAQPRRRRRWAIGGYFRDVDGMTPFGEMHVRRGHYIGVAPLPNGVTNACLVLPHRRGDAPLVRPDQILQRFLRSDRVLQARFERATPIDPAVMLGPMAVEALAAGEPGLLLAGDAAGFVDPMTGDGMRFAFVGAELAAGVAQQALDGSVSIDRAHLELGDRRRRAFGNKLRFNRALRALVASPVNLTIAAAAAKTWPSVFARMIDYAGDCDHATTGQPHEYARAGRR